MANSEKSTSRNNASLPGKKNPWIDNIHLRQERSQNLIDNYKNLDEASKFIDYIQHVENQKRLAYQSKVKEIKLMQKAGSTDQDHFAELRFAIED